jgi:hypothetical protein
MKRHEVKIWPENFTPLDHGEKTAEYRKDDRGYAVGDIVVAKEWDPNTERYTGRVTIRRISHIVRGGCFGMPVGYVMISLNRTLPQGGDLSPDVWGQG